MSSAISVSELAATVTEALKDYIDVTEEAAAKGVQQTANEVVEELRSARPSGSGEYGSWDAYNASWKRTNLKKTKHGTYSDVIHNEKHYQLAHLLEKGHALANGGRARAFPHIAPAAEKAEKQLLDNIKRNIK